LLLTAKNLLFPAITPPPYAGILHLDSRVRGNERKVSRALDDRGCRSLIRVESLGGRCRVTWRRLRYLGRGDGT
jgi:hypothetical protein